MGNATARACFLLAVVASFAGTLARAGTFFAYTDAQRVYTLEFRKPNRAVFNVLNLSRFIQVIEPQDFLVAGRSGSVVVGQVFAEKDQSGQVRYTASRIVPPRTFSGVDLWGAFPGVDDPLRVFATSGGRVFEMESLDEAAFDVLLSRLEETDLSAEDMVAELKSREVPDYGIYHSFEEAQGYLPAFEKALTEDGVNPTKVIRQVPVALTPEAEAAGFREKVVVRIAVDMAGNIVSFTFEKPPPYGMGRRIEESIRNGWRFLPATSGGEVVASEARITLDFSRQNPAAPAGTR